MPEHDHSWNEMGESLSRAVKRTNSGHLQTMKRDKRKVHDKTRFRDILIDTQSAGVGQGQLKHTHRKRIYLKRPTLRCFREQERVRPLNKSVWDAYTPTSVEIRAQ